MAEFAADGRGTELRRAITPWGSYTWGYADVGADIYVALGLVLASAEGLANVAFLFAGLVYVTVGLAYTELSSMYPMAGGGQLFVLRGLGDLWGFVAGWAVLLDFTIDIALFALFSAGYLDHFFPSLSRPPWIILEAAVLVIFLYGLNVVGVRESTALNSFAAALDIATETTLIFIGFMFAFDPAFYWHQVTTFLLHFDSSKLFYGTSLAIISFVGLESIAQAAQETERPTTIVPRTSVALILTILAYALALSNLALGMIPWQTYDPATTHQFCGGLAPAACSAAHLAHQNAPVAWLAIHLPVVGSFVAPLIAILGTLLLLISSNAGVYGSSRIMYSMALNDLTPKVFTRVQARFRTPVVTLTVFTAIALGELIFAGLTADAANTLGDMYAFGAASSYTLVFVSLLVLRFTDTETPRSFRVPWNVTVRRNGRSYQVPIVGVLGLIGISSVLLMVILTHPIGRVAGPVWIVLGFVGYVIYRKRRKLPALGSVRRDWPAAQLHVYEESGELTLAEEYRDALRHQHRANGHEPAVNDEVLAHPSRRG
ncbi:MAG TPA: APC family permease [Chloroflexota bacterium]|nr:APC family permease [Chloroflexota bacterium]